MKSEFLQKINNAGQVIWYDNLSRDVLEDGTLAGLIEEGVSGLTSNPTIFQKAILSSNSYDEAIRKHLVAGKAQGLTDQALIEFICEELCVADVQSAANLLQGAYEQSEGRDGFVSLEVSPSLAYDVQGTVAAAQRLWRKLDRANAMIKVPATLEGVQAFESLIAEGINVNVTLIFSVDRYRQVIEAYKRAIDTRLKSGLSVKEVFSVASFFVSRVDSIVTKKRGGEEDEFLGKISVANCRLAYEVFRESFLNTEFSATRANLQKPLWASTGVKSDRLSQVFYVEKLVAEYTVNTLPPATVKSVLAGLSMGSLLDLSIDEAKSKIKALEVRGVSFNDLLDELMDDGVKLFDNSFRDLLNGLAKKVKELSE
jgi:transaldolase